MPVPLLNPLVQLNMAVFFWNRVKSNLSSVRYFSGVHWTSNFFQDTRNTQPSLTGHPVRPCIVASFEEE